MDDLASYVASGGAGDAVPGRRLLAEHVAAVEAGLDEGTLRTYRTHFRRLVEGTAPQCPCLCLECVDVVAGCGCDCRDCDGKLSIPVCGERPVVAGEFKRSEFDVYKRVAIRMASKKATKDNVGRARRRLALKGTNGHGGGENAVAAWRRLFKMAVDDELLRSNPVENVSKPPRSDSNRRALRDEEIGPFFDAVVTGGDDPELDFHLAWFHTETGARRDGALNLRVGDLKDTEQIVEVFEKFGVYRDQPVSAELIAALRAFAASRGGPRCDPSSAEYDPTAPVFYYGRPRKRPGKDGRGAGAVAGTPWPLTSRRYDGLHERLQQTLPWAAEIELTAHALRRTGATIVERIAGTQVARAFLGHSQRNVTETYTGARGLEEVAEAVSKMTGRPHPLTARRHSGP